MSASTQHPQEAWRWLVTASKVVRPDELGTSPARRSVLEQSRTSSRVGANVYAAYEYALTHLLPLAPASQQIEKALYDATRAALIDGKPVDVALEEAARNAN